MERRAVPTDTKSFMDVWLRVAMGIVLILAPSVLFVLLYRGLLRLQDQELIARLAEAGHLDPSLVEPMDGTSGHDRPRGVREGNRSGTLSRNVGVNERRAAFLRDHGGPQSRSTAAHSARGERQNPMVPEVVGARDREIVRCGHCGLENAAEFGLCWNCLEWLD